MRILGPMFKTLPTPPNFFRNSPLDLHQLNIWLVTVLTALVPPYRIKLVGRGLSIRSRSMRWSSRDPYQGGYGLEGLVHERERVMVENPGISD